MPQAKTGRRPYFRTPQQLQSKIDDYFKSGVNVRKVVVGSGKSKRIEKISVPTITGLVLHCGFESRQSFYDYEKYEEFSYTIKRARLLIEQLYEERLQTGNPTGAIFALKNFGWKDRQEIVQREEARDFSEVSDEELDESIERHLDTHLQEYYGVKLADLKKKTVA